MPEAAWRRQANCYRRGGDLFDHDTWHRPALELCRDCPVKRDCLEDALQRKQASDCGVWGFSSLAQRERMRQGHTTPQNVWAYNQQRIDREAEKERDAASRATLFDEAAATAERLATVDRLFVYVGA